MPWSPTSPDDRARPNRAGSGSPATRGASWMTGCPRRDRHRGVPAAARGTRRRRAQHGRIRGGAMTVAPKVASEARRPGRCAATPRARRTTCGGSARPQIACPENAGSSVTGCFQLPRSGRLTLPAEDRGPWCAGTRTLTLRARRCDGRRMNRWWPHRTAVASGQLVTRQKRASPLDVAARGCRGPARPTVTVVMTSAASRLHPVELFLRGHHFRASRAALQAAGAAAYDKTGTPVITTGTRTADAPGRSVGGPAATAHSR